jgi:uncharacterized membrane protein SirB2
MLSWRRVAQWVYAKFSGAFTASVLKVELLPQWRNKNNHNKSANFIVCCIVTCFSFLKIAIIKPCNLLAWLHNDGFLKSPKYVAI